jgi:hypothetical protein
LPGSHPSRHRAGINTIHFSSLQVFVLYNLFNRIDILAYRLQEKTQMSFQSRFLQQGRSDSMAKPYNRDPFGISERADVRQVMAAEQRMRL